LDCDHNVGYKVADKHTASILSRVSKGDDSMFLRNSTHLRTRFFVTIMEDITSTLFGLKVNLWNGGGMLCGY